VRPAAGQGINLEDNFARLHLARMCAYVLHSDQASTDVSRDGAPFWQMLCLLATRWVRAWGCGDVAGACICPQLCISCMSSLPAVNG
jgi:hypothetical protein